MYLVKKHLMLCDRHECDDEDEAEFLAMDCTDYEEKLETVGERGHYRQRFDEKRAERKKRKQRDKEKKRPNVKHNKEKKK